MNIRPAKVGDIPAIIDLLRQVGQVHHNIRPDIFRDGAQKYDEAKANLSNAVNLAKAAQSQYDMALNGARQDEKLAAHSMAERLVKAFRKSRVWQPKRN